MVSKRAAHSRSEDDLPAGWSKRFQVLKTGRKVKYYEDSRTGGKLFSKDHILQYVEILDALQPTERRARKRSNPSKLRSGTEEATNELLEWLPRGWLVRIRSRKNGPRRGDTYKTYVELSTGRMFYSRVEVLRYLKAVKGKSCISPASSAKPKVVIETSSEDLPPGWIKELEIRKNAGGIRKDPYYRDPRTRCVFRSRREVEHYLETGEISRRAILETERRIVGKRSQSASAKGEKFVDHNAGTHLYADKHGGVRGTLMMSETEQPSVSTLETSHEHSPETNASSNSAESQERISESRQGYDLNGTSQSRSPIPNANNEEELILPLRYSRRVARIEPGMVPDSVSGSLATQDESTGDCGTSKEVSEEQIPESENGKEYSENSPVSWSDSDKIQEVISHRRFSRRLARLKSEQESKSTSKSRAAPDATNSREDGDVIVTSTSKCMTTEASQSSCPIVNASNEEELILPRRFSRRIARHEPELVPDSAFRRLATREESTGDGATSKDESKEQEQIVESGNDKEGNGNSPCSWRDSDKIKEVISHHRFSRRMARSKSEQESKSISKALAVPDVTNSQEERGVTATSTSKCMTIEASQFLEATVNVEKQEGGSSNASMGLLRKGSINDQVNLQDKPALKVAAPVESGGGSALMSTPPTDDLNPEISFKHDEEEIVIRSSKSMHSKRFDFSQKSQKCPSEPVPEPKSYPSISKISKTTHIEKVGSQNTSVVNRKDDVIQEQGFPLSARSGKGKRGSDTSSEKSGQGIDHSLECRYPNRTAGLRQEPVGKPPHCESTNGDNAMPLPVKDIPGKQHQDVETNKTGNDNSSIPEKPHQDVNTNTTGNDNNSIPEKQHQDVETNKTRNDNNSWFGPSSADIWADPCIEFAFKTLTGALQIEDFLNSPLISTSAVSSGNEKNLNLDTSQKITENKPKVPSTAHMREIVLALKSKKQLLGSGSAQCATHGKPGSAGSFPRGVSSLNSLQNDSSQKFKVSGFMEYANSGFGFARKAKQYASLSKSQEPHHDSTIMPLLLGNLVVPSMQNKDAAPTSFLSFGDCWSDPLLEYALETPTGLKPLKGDLSKLARLQHQLGASCSYQNTSFQPHETILNQKDGETDISHSCFETDTSYCSLAPDQSRPISKPRIPRLDPPLLPASATPVVLACSSSMNSAESHLNGKTKRGRPENESLKCLHQ